ncbi:TPA: TIGR03750 family conjugal transfer protein [Klebsiella quasipneumoniae subsp. quasipneumoniae]|nr:TIGR03750 family conjugal transfer protein [Klebsiella quasipneumoniae subsp. quasipneumoniae]
MDTVTFLPHRLNRQPVVVRGLTADELWICVIISAIVGILIGLCLLSVIASLAILPSSMLLSVTLGIVSGGGFLRRQKRNRPDTWLWRQFQWHIASHYPLLTRFTGGQELITRSGYWSTRRFTGTRQ